MNEHRHGQGDSLLATDRRRDELRRQSHEWLSWTLAGSALAGLEALVAGFFWPAKGYGQVHASTSDAGSEHEVDECSGPALCVPPGFAERVAPGMRIALRDPEGVLLAVLAVDDKRQRDGSWCLEGSIEGIELPGHDDFREHRASPAALAERVRRLGYPRVLAMAPQHVFHAGMRAAVVEAAQRLDAAILVVIGTSGAEHDELADFNRVRALLTSANLLPAVRTTAGVVPLPPSVTPLTYCRRSALVARNCGATHFAIDTAHVGPADVASLNGSCARFGIDLVPLTSWVYDLDRRQLVSPDAPADRHLVAPGAPEILASVAAVPEWLLTSDEKDSLLRAHVPRHAQGFTVFLTGLSGSGKSTIARALQVRLMEMTGRPVTLLDGDRVRRHLSSELGFSREHRDINILRIGWVAAEITRHGGIAVCAPIAPYDAIRRQVRHMVEVSGGFLLVHVSTPLETCEARDRKGLYAKARAGLLPQFTGISDPYETPMDAAVTVDTRSTSVDDACGLVLAALTTQGYLTQQP